VSLYEARGEFQLVVDSLEESGEGALQRAFEQLKAKLAAEGLFAGVAIIGSALLNLGAKPLFARDRPSLWESIAPEGNYSFPSGHAMGSMTLACVLVLLCWWTRVRWPVCVAAIVFVTLVGASRVYLGVHYPSDILAGWAAAIAWTYAVYGMVFRGGMRPWGGMSVGSGSA